jgi:hypothetical protein
MFTHRLTRTATVALAVVATAAPAASAMPADGIGTTATQQQAQDLRSPDTRDAAEGRRVYTPVPAEPQAQDLRSPDTRDFAAGRGTYNSPDVVVVKSPASAPAPTTAGGIDWEDVGIGAGALFSVALIGLGGALAIVHRRGSRQLAG